MRHSIHRIGQLFELQFDANPFSLSAYGKAEREPFFEMLQHYWLGHDGAMFMGGDFNCKLVRRLDRCFVSPPGRHDSLAL